jgi:hypothetical protein
MMKRSLKPWFRRAAPAPSRFYRPQLKKLPRRLFVESLEERTVPSILFGDTPGLSVTGSSTAPVLDHAQIRLVFWGNGWNSGIGPALRTQVETAIDAINSSPYFYSPLPGADLSQYRWNIRQPVRVASFTKTYNSPGLTFTNTDVFNMLVHEFGMTHNYYYYVIPDPNSTPTGCGCAAEHTYWYQGSDTDANREYYGFSRNLASPSLDDLTRLYSHEMAESITDPDGGATQVTPRPPGGGWWEISDGEAQNYTYRMSNGYLVQSYWSSADGKFTVPTGQSQNFYVSSTGVLTINGDQRPNKNDTINISQTFTGGVSVSLNGEIAQFEPSAITGIKVDTKTGNNSVNVDRTSVPVDIRLNGANDTATICQGSKRLEAIGANVTVTGSIGFDSLYVYDQNAPLAQTYTINSSSLKTTLSATISYSLINGITIYGSDWANKYVINGTSPYSPGTTLNTGDGNDDVDVYRTTGTLTIKLGAGTDNVTISPAAHNLNDISGSVTVTGGSGTDRLFINDQGNLAAGTSYAMTATSVQRPGSAPISYSAIDYVTINGGNASDSYDITGTEPIFRTTLNTAGTLNTVRVRATGGPLTVNVSANDNVLLANSVNALDGIARVTVNDLTGSSTVTVDDSGHVGDETYTITNASVRAARLPGTLLTYAGIGQLVLNGGTSNVLRDVFEIESTSVTTTVNGGPGTNCFHASKPGQYLASIVGTLNLNGSGADVLDFFDTGNPAAAETYNFDNVPSMLTLGTVGGFLCKFSGMSSVYVMTNGTYTDGDLSGTVIYDPLGGPPC